MKNKLLMLAGAALVAVTAPAVAKPGHGPAQPKGHVSHMVKGHPTNMVKGQSVKVKMHKQAHKSRYATLRDRNRNGIDDRDEALARRYGGALCPPGLAKKTPACMPPGQAKRVFRTGQRVPLNYRYYTPYGDIPQALIDRYDLTNQYRYIYRDNTIYVVDPTTRLISNIINAVL